MALEESSPELDVHDADTLAPPAVPPPRGPGARSVPPPLPDEASRPPAARFAADTAFADQMMERLASGDSLGALIAAEALLEYRPFDADALDTAQMARAELRKVYIARLGSLERIPKLSMPLEALLVHTGLEARAAFVLARVDGVASVRAIVEGAGMHATDALRVLSELFLRRAVAFDD